MIYKVLLATILLTITAIPAEAQLLLKSASCLSRKMFREVGGEAIERAGKQAVSTAARKAGSHGVGRVSSSLSTKLVRTYGDDAAQAMSKVSAQSARRLTLLGPEIQASGQGKQFMAFLAKRGDADQIIDFIFRNKGTLAGGVLLTAIIANPEKVLGAASKSIANVVSAAGESVVEPMAAEVGRPLARWLGVTFFATAMIALAGWLTKFCWSSSKEVLGPN